LGKIATQMKLEFHTMYKKEFGGLWKIGPIFILLYYLSL
jgi:hypothetical protein